jgi:hypothetical protein
MRTVVEVVGLVMNSGAVFVISTSALLTRNLLRGTSAKELFV